MEIRALAKLMAGKHFDSHKFIEILGELAPKSFILPNDNDIIRCGFTPCFNAPIRDDLVDIAVLPEPPFDDTADYEWIKVIIRVEKTGFTIIDSSVETQQREHA